MSEVSRISVDGMDDLISKMKDAGEALTSDLDIIRARMQLNEVPMDRFNSTNGIDYIAEWIEDQIPGLERRHNLAVGITAEQPATTLVDVDESLVIGTAEEAEQEGRGLAQQFVGGEIEASTFDELMEEFGPHIHDPDFMAGFYLELGPERAQLLPEWLIATGADEQYLEQFSIGLGTALNTTDSMSKTSDYFTELSGFRQHFAEPTDDPQVAWNRLALLQHGDFPPRWLADVTRHTVLEHLEGADWDTTDYRGRSTPQLGLSEDTLALALSALGNNPSASRIALLEKSGFNDPTDPGDNPLDEYVDRIYGLAFTSASGDDIAGALGEALAAGSGSLDDPPDKGGGSRFAQMALLAMAQQEDTPWAMQEHIDTITAAYIEELLASTWAGDDIDLPPGLEPTFELSPEDTYRVLYGLGGYGSQKFEAALGELFATLSADSLAADLAAIDAGNPDPAYFEATINMFATLTGLTYEAQIRHRHASDERSAAIVGGIETVVNVLTLGRGKPAIETLKRLIDIVMPKPSNQIEVVKLLLEDRDEQTLTKLLITQMFHRKYPAGTSLPYTLMGADGRLLDPAVIAGDEDLLEEFEDWFDKDAGTALTDMWSIFEEYRIDRPQDIADDTGWGEKPY